MRSNSNECGTRERFRSRERERPASLRRHHSEPGGAWVCSEHRSVMIHYAHLKILARGSGCGFIQSCGVAAPRPRPPAVNRMGIRDTIKLMGLNRF